MWRLPCPCDKRKEGWYSIVKYSHIEGVFRSISGWVIESATRERSNDVLPGTSLVAQSSYRMTPAELIEFKIQL